MKLSEKRWNVAVKEAKRIISMLEHGYIAFNDVGEKIFDVEIVDNKIFQKVGKGCIYLMHERNEEYDHGSHTPVEEIKRTFRRIKFYKEVKYRNPKNAK
jgi:hypothetical protein